MCNQIVAALLSGIKRQRGQERSLLVPNTNNITTMMRYLAVLLLVAAATATEFRTCKNDRPSPSMVEVSGCDTLPCDFIRGSDLSSDITFTSADAAESLKPKVMVTVLGLTIEYPLEQDDACQNLISGGCPLEAGDEAIYQLVMPILDEYPPVSLTIEFSLLDQDDNTVTCFVVDGKVSGK